MGWNLDISNSSRVVNKDESERLSVCCGGKAILASCTHSSQSAPPGVTDVDALFFCSPTVLEMALDTAVYLSEPPSGPHAAGLSTIALAV